MNENVTKEARTYAMLCHLSALSGLIIPLGTIFGPLIFWMLKKDEYSFVDQEGKEALNFEISMFIYYVISGLLTIVIIGIFMLGLLAAFHLIVVIVAAVRANSGDGYRYPMTIRFIK